jgi:Phytanoyl-CoA dioxygenase (PhyH)
MAVSRIKRFLRQGRKKEFTWRYVYNFGPTVRHRLTGHRLQGELSRIVHELDQKGIALTSVADIFGSTAHFDEMCRAVEQIEAERSAEIQALRSEATNADSIGRKTFMAELLGPYPVLNPNDVFGRVALQPNVIHIANAYFGMFTRLRHYNVWHTFCSPSKARESQLWHHDREDFFILKMFIYLKDVREGGGPFTYAPGTHQKGPLKQREPEYFVEGGVRRTTDEQMNAVVPQHLWVKATGGSGTIVFADTRGYHKGGECRTADRLMYTCMFTSKSSESQEWLRQPTHIGSSPDAEIAFALSGPRR